MRKFMNTLLAGVLSLSMVAGVAAQTTGSNQATVQITTTNGALVVSINSATFDSKPYSFDQQTTTGTITVGAQDNRGNGAGWFVTIHGDDFSNGETGADLQTIPVGNLSLTGSGVTRIAGQGENTVSQSAVTSMPSTTATSATIMNATKNNGRGQYTGSYAGSLVIPAGTLVDTYTSTLYVSITTAP